MPRKDKAERLAYNRAQNRALQELKDRYLDDYEVIFSRHYRQTRKEVYSNGGTHKRPGPRPGFRAERGY